MGYNKSKRSVLRSIIQLDQLEATMKTIKFPTSDPKSMQHRLNEALAAADTHEEYKHYATNLRPVYRFEVEEGYVIARYMMFDDTLGQSYDDRSNGKHKSKVQDLDITIDNAYSLIDVLGSLLGNLNAEEITFPNTVLSESDKLKLWAWTKESDHTEWLFIDREDKGIILTRKDNIPVEMLWAPEQEENEFEV